MSSQDHAPISRLLSLVVSILLLLSFAFLPALAQNTVPATARQAATLPQYASRLAPPAQRPPAGRLPGRHPMLQPQDGIIYENGPVNGTADAWTINYGFADTDSVQATGQVSAIDFYAWLIPGDVITSIEVDFGTQQFGSDLFSGTINLTQSNCTTNQYGYNVCLETGNITNGPNLAGDAWLTLQNANVPSGDPVYWDENSGVGCGSPGCPSQAAQNDLGTIPSESFDVFGSNPPPMCGVNNFSWKRVGHALAQSFQVIYNFLGGEAGLQPTALTLDQGGNFYGATFGGGNTAPPCYSYGCGTVFHLTHQNSGWTLHTIYRFNGMDGDGPSSRVTIGPDGRLYGVTWLGGDPGGGLGGGVVYSLKPPAHACPNVLCTWTGSVLHSFSWPGDGADPSGGSCSLQKAGQLRSPSPLDDWDGNEPSGDVIFDHAGNLYGTAPWGLAGGECGCGFACGMVYKLTPAQGPWHEDVLYRFQGGTDGGTPESGVIFGNDGNLYGTTESRGLGGGTVFRLTGTGLDVLHSFPYYDRYGSRPTGGLIQDPDGNLFGTTAEGGLGCGGCGCGTAFEMVGTGSFTSLYGFSGGVGAFSGPGSRLVRDTDGNLYGTTTADGAYARGSVFKLSPSPGGWIYTDIYDFTGGDDGYNPSGLTMDASGNLWGAANGGALGNGLIFEITP